MEKDKIITYSVHNGGTALQCICRNFFDIPKKKKFKCPKCNESYENINGFILRLGE